MEYGDKVLILPKGREHDLDDEEVIMSISEQELDERVIFKGDLVLLGMDEYNISNQLRFVRNILTSEDFPKGTIAEGQCIIHVESILNTTVQNGSVLDYDDLWKEALTAILVYGFDTKKYKWIGYPNDKPMANRVLNFFQRHVRECQFKDFTDKYGAIWFKEKSLKDK